MQEDSYGGQSKFRQLLMPWHAPKLFTAMIVILGIVFVGSSSSVQAMPGIFHPQSTGPTALPPTAIAEARTSYMIELDAPPVAVVYAQAYEEAITAASMASITQAHLHSVEAAQAQLAVELAALDAQEIFRTQRVYNGIAVRANRHQLEIIGALPGVKAIHPLIAKYPTNARSVPYTGAPSLWAGIGLEDVKRSGEGIRVAVIDTGIDYLHTDFGGPGTGYAANDPTVIGDAPNFPGIKVSAGYDFAGEAYNAKSNDTSYQPIPEPDPDPMDCYAHGTHVAGTVAGYGVEWDGATFNGPYDTPLDFDQFKIGPGMAPLAEIYALKIFGCYGWSELTDLAIEWAVDPDGDGDFSDHVDVINMSLGSPFGSVYDTSAIASNNAASVGVIVVASAGNSGDTYFATGSPAVADRIISVAAVGLPNSTPGAEAEIASFSARGPRTPDSALKPDIAAPGRNIYSALSGSGDGGKYSSGTSMAAPHIAGAAALLRERYPMWTVEEIKALLMNSANFPAGESISATPFGPTRTGAGVIDLSRMISPTLLAYVVDAPGAVSLSFGAPEVTDTTTLTRTLRLVNKGVTTTVVSVSYESLNDLPGADIELAITTPITISAVGQVELPVRMRAVAADLKHVRDPATAEVQFFPRHWLAEETGFVLITPTNPYQEDDQNEDAEQPLGQVRVPLHAAPRPAANLQADGPLKIGSNMEGKITLLGTGLTGTNPPVDVISMVSAFELAYSRPMTAIAASGRIVDPQAYGVLDNVGVTSDYVDTKSLDQTMLYFGIATEENWSSPNRLQVNIYVDTNSDGVDDFRLFNSNENGYYDSGQTNDAFVTVVENLETGQFSRWQLLNLLSALAFDTAIYNNRVMILPVRAMDIGLTEEASQFRYRIETAVAEEEEVWDQTPVFIYDARRPGLDLFSDNPTAPLIEAEDGTEIVVRLDMRNYSDNESKGLLLLHHHNRADEHVQALPMRLDLTESLYLPIISRDGNQ